jgi:hypothetical protein
MSLRGTETVETISMSIDKLNKERYRRTVHKLEESAVRRQKVERTMMGFDGNDRMATWTRLGAICLLWAGFINDSRMVKMLLLAIQSLVWRGMCFICSEVLSFQYFQCGILRLAADQVGLDPFKQQQETKVLRGVWTEENEE